MSNLVPLWLYLVRYVPAWVPGAGFQKLGRKGAELRTGFADEAFKMVFDQVVSVLILDYVYAV